MLDNKSFVYFSEDFFKKLLNHVIVKGQGALKTQTLGEIPLLGTLQLTAFTGGSSTLINDIHAFFQTWGVKIGDRVKNVTKDQTCSVVSVISQMQLTTTPLIAASWDDDAVIQTQAHVWAGVTYQKFFQAMFLTAKYGY